MDFVFILGRCFLLVVLAGLQKYNNSGGEAQVSLTCPSYHGLFHGFSRSKSVTAPLSVSITKHWHKCDA